MISKPTYEDLEQRIKELEKERIEYKRTEGALKDNKNKFQDLADSIDDIFFALDNDLNYTYWNKACSRLFGISSEIMVGKPYLNFEFNKGYEWIADIYKEVIHYRKSRNFESSFDLDNKKFWYEIKAYPSSSGCAVIIKDITERKQAEKSLQKAHDELELKVEERTIGLTNELQQRKRAEESLRKSKYNLATHLRDTPVGVVFMDLNFKVTEWNPAAEIIFGYTNEEAIGINIFDFITSKKTKGLVYGIFLELMSEKGGKHSRNENITKDDRRILCDWYNIALKDVDGKVIGIASLVQDITQRKRVEESLLESEERFKTLSTLTFEGILTHNNGVIIDSNRAATKILGYAREELIGENIIQLCVPQEYHATIKENIVKSFAKPYEVMARRKDGTLFPAEIEAKDIKKNNKIFRVAAIRDITQRKKIEEELRESEERFRKIYEHMAVGVAQISLEFRIKRANKAYCSMIGYREEELIGKHLKDITHPEILEENLRKQSQLINGKMDHYQLEKRFIHKNGDVIYGILDANLVRNSQGKSLYFLGSVVDITERKKMEKELQKSEEKYRSMMESMKNASYICSPELHIEYMNTAMIDRVGTDAIGKICHKAIYDRDEKCSWCVFDQIQKGEHVDYEVTNPKDNRYYSVSNSPISHSNGTISKLTIFHDITEIKDIEAQLRQSRKMESIGTLTGGIAHDFNNLLYMISGNAELALEDIPKWNPVHTNLKEIKSASLKAAGIVKQLLNFSRTTDQKMKPIGAVTVIKDALKFLRSTIPTIIDIRKHLPDTDITILADPVQINQVLMNLCINASQAMEDTGGILEIIVENVSLDEEAADRCPDLTADDYLKITVNDTGPGISTEIIEQIFDPYFTTKEMGKGSGMGLSIVHGIVQNHSGAISVDSKVGKGTTFSLLFPVVDEKPVDDIKTSGEQLLGTESILFVDDEESITNMMQQILEKLGYHVEAKLNPKEALDLFNSKPDSFDLIITDMTMPQMTGAKFAKKLKEIRSDIPIILCTGHSSLIDEDKAKQSGISGYVMKPVSMSKIAKAIREALDR